MFYHEVAFFHGVTETTWERRLSPLAELDHLDVNHRIYFLNFLERPIVERHGQVEGLYIVDNRGTLLVRCDLILLKINFEIWQSFYNEQMDKIIKNLDYNAITEILKNSTNRIIDNPVIIGDPYVWNYYHFTYDFLSKASLCGHYPSCPVLCPMAVLANPTQRAMLERHVAPHRLVPIILPMLVNNPIIGYSSFSERNIDIRRRTLGTRPAGRRRIHIRRRRRAPTNAAGLEALLARYGFETVDFEGSSFDDQLNMLQGAGMIVAAHGANLVNTSFIDGPVTLVELFSSDHISPDYFFIANHLGNRYHPIIGRPDGDNENFKVPLDQLTAVIERNL